MGFGFNLFCAFLLVPLTLLLLATWGITKKNIFARAVGFLWGGLLLLVVLATIGKALLPDTALAKNDYYGQYVINRNYFPGKQADWQYNTFRFEIQDNDSIYFYLTNQEKIVQVFKGTISVVKPIASARLVLHMAQPTQHILSSNPTTYRSARGFYLVFNSPKFGNVFFTKGEWQPLPN